MPYAHLFQTLPTPTASFKQRLVASGFLLVSQLFLLLLLFHAFSPGGVHPALQQISHFLIAKTLGLTAFFLPLALCWSGISLYYHLFRLTPFLHQLFYFFGFLFSLNLLLLNSSLINTQWSGVFPLFFHAILLAKFGSPNPTTVLWLEAAATLFFLCFLMLKLGLFGKMKLQVLKRTLARGGLFCRRLGALLLRLLSFSLRRLKECVKVCFEVLAAVLKRRPVPLVPLAGLARFKRLLLLKISPLWPTFYRVKDEALTAEARQTLEKKVVLPLSVLEKLGKKTAAELLQPAKPLMVFSAAAAPSTTAPPAPAETTIPNPPPATPPQQDRETHADSFEITTAPSLAAEENAESISSPLPKATPPDEVRLDLSGSSLFQRSAPFEAAAEPAAPPAPPPPWLSSPPGAANPPTAGKAIDRSQPKLPSVINPLSFKASVNPLNPQAPQISPNTTFDLQPSAPFQRPEPHHQQKQREQEIKAIAAKLEQTISEFGIAAKVVGAATGPVITQFQITIEPGVRITRIVNLADNLALSLAAESIRIVAPVPGKSVIGIEVPNPTRQMVQLSQIVKSPSFQKSPFRLPIALGASILGAPVVVELAAMPHLLVAGATGSGKSVCINAIITSLLLKRPPSQVRFLMIDPKMVELNVYNGIPHLLHPVIVDPKKASAALRWTIGEMEARYRLLEKHGVRNIASYNEKLLSQNSPPPTEAHGLPSAQGTLPYIVVVIDEFGDLMMVARREIEDAVTRLAAMSRAVGIHLLLATQRPSVDVITGIIKANFPSRIAFQVSSKIDSRTIIDASGAESLLGKGDLLFQNVSAAAHERIQGAFVSDESVKRLTQHLKQHEAPNYLEEVVREEKEDPTPTESIDDEDSLFKAALEITFQDKKISASYLQRKLKIGYNRAARIVEKMEEKGIVSSADGPKPRAVLISQS